MSLDNTNADQDVRTIWVNLAKKHSIPIRCVLFTAPAKLCEHNDTIRALNLGSDVGFPTLAFSPGTGLMCLPDEVTSARDKMPASVNGVAEYSPRTSIGVRVRTIGIIDG